MHKARRRRRSPCPGGIFDVCQWPLVTWRETDPWQFSFPQQKPWSSLPAPGRPLASGLADALSDTTFWSGPRTRGVPSHAWSDSSGACKLCHTSRTDGIPSLPPHRIAMRRGRAGLVASLPPPHSPHPSSFPPSDADDCDEDWAPPRAPPRESRQVPGRVRSRAWGSLVAWAQFFAQTGQGRENYYHCSRRRWRPPFWRPDRRRRQQRWWARGELRAGH